MLSRVPYFSGLNNPAIHANAIYIFDSTIGPSGALRIATTSDFSSGGGGTGVASTVTIANQPIGISGTLIPFSGTFNFFITGLTTGTFQIPAGARSFAVACASGLCYVNGISISAGTSIRGGSFDRYSLQNAVLISGNSLNYSLITWEV